MARQGTLQFDERFMPRYAGALIYDPAVALVELVANAWDAYATRVDVEWPDRPAGKPFCVVDNGKGMKAQEFEKRWTTFDYNRPEHEGPLSYPPAELASPASSCLRPQWERSACRILLLQKVLGENVA